MSKINHRNAVKSLSVLPVDCQYLYQIGIQVFNDNGQNPEIYKELCDNLKNITTDMLKSLEEIKSLIPQG